MSSTRKRSAESQPNSERERMCSRELSSSKELADKSSNIRVEDEEEKKLHEKAGGDEEVLTKSLPGHGIPVEAEAASISKEEVTIQAKEVTSQVLEEETGDTRPHAEVLEPEVAPQILQEVAPHTPQEVETEEVTSQATLEMSVEDESVQEDEDPFAEERKEVLHELEVVANEKDAKHALMENLKKQIRQVEVRHVSQQKLVKV